MVALKNKVRNESGGFASDDVYVFPVVHRLGELDRTVSQRIQGPILAYTYVFARVEFGSLLTYDDVTCNHALTAENLDAKTLAVGFATVFGTTDAFLVCHCIGVL